MALKIGNPSTRKVSVDAIEPLDYDRIQKHTFEAELGIIPKHEWDELIKGENKLTDSEILNRTLKNIDGLVGADNQPMVFDDSIKSAILEIPWLVSALIDKQIAIQIGKTSAEYQRLRLKN